MADNDLADERGNTVGTARAQHPQLNVNLDPATETTPTGDQIVLAQDKDEVLAQIANAEAED